MFQDIQSRHFFLRADTQADCLLECEEQRSGRDGHEGEMDHHEEKLRSELVQTSPVEETRVLATKKSVVIFRKESDRQRTESTNDGVDG